jgi:hypothetical protein
MFEILKGKPMPPDGRSQRFQRNCKYDIVYDMEVGDCVIVKDRAGANALGHRCRRGIPQIGFATRKLPDGTIGFWRTE